MKRTYLLIPFLFLAFVFSSCSVQQGLGEPTVDFATPTRYALFEGGSLLPTSLPGGSLEATAIPTVSGFFDFPVGNVNQPTITPPAPIVEPFQTSSANLSGVETRIVSIFDNELNANWQMLNSERTTVDVMNEEYVYAGTKSIKITPQEAFGTAYFVVRSDSTQTYPRDKVLGLEFKLNGGKNPIQTKDLGVTVLGSNDYNYFVAGDHSVTSAMDPVFSETRLYYLGINETVPPDTWVDVVLWLNDRQYDPVYKYVTAFYLKNDEGFQFPYYIDDVHLIMAATQAVQATPDPLAGTVVTSSSNVVDTVANVNVDLTADVHPISPMVYGVTTTSRDVLMDIRPGLNSWGGNVTSRFNWKLTAANTGSDGSYTNTDLGLAPNTTLDQVLSYARYINAATRVTLPTLGWVAKNSNPFTCSFPLPDGTCGDAGKSSCLDPKQIADPRLADVESNVDLVVEWAKHLSLYTNASIFAMDNEPDMWGITHYDVHPECTTYQEMLQKYLEYAVPVREAAPKALLAGPVVSGWDHYWNSPAGANDKQQNGNEDFLPWFLDQLKKHDTETGVPSIDVLDIHYSPDGLNNQNIDAETATRRSQATRSLWDKTYIDEGSAIQDPINLIPRMRDVIAQHYPGLQLGISAWNFGADKNINGALAIADVLGILGRDDIFYASYASSPPMGSPGAFAFKIYTNYDGYGNKFGSNSVQATSDMPDLVSSYASVDPRTGQIHLIIINKHPSSNISVKVNIADFKGSKRTTLYRYSRETVDKIVMTNVKWPEDGMLEIPPYSISHYVIAP